MGKCRKCWSNSGARWDGKILEMSGQSWSKVEWENVGAESEKGGKKMVYDTSSVSIVWGRARLFPDRNS